MIFLGIDPGLSGAVVRLEWPSGELSVRRDFRSLPDIAEAIRGLSVGVDLAVLELVAAMPGQGVTSMFSFGRSVGVALGALYCRNLSFVEVTPVRWQGYWREGVGWGKKEFDSREIARRVMPEAAQYLKRVKDHGTADALLLAAFGASVLGGAGQISTSRAKGKRIVGGEDTFTATGSPGSRPGRSG